ncbi:MAG: hypothetical protein L3J42_05710 [Hydrogenimonas sp.]|nr:hypothetical protein [Hydrogenimonas sp.]
MALGFQPGLNCLKGEAKASLLKRELDFKIGGKTAESKKGGKLDCFKNL